MITWLKMSQKEIKSNNCQLEDALFFYEEDS